MTHTLTLRRAIALAVAVGLLFPVCLSGWQTLRQQHADLNAALDNDQKRLVSLLATAMAGPIWNVDHSALQLLEHAAARDDRVVSIRLSTQQGEIPEYRRPKPPQGQVRIAEAPVETHGQEMGRVRVEMDTAQLDSQLREQYLQVILVAAAQLVLSLTLILFILNVRFVEPIRRLLQESGHLARRELDNAFVWYRRDELGELGNSLESTRQALQAAFKELKESEQRFRSLTDLSSDWYWERDAEDRLVILSPSFEEITGIPRSELLGSKRGDQSSFHYDAESLRKSKACIAARQPFYDLKWSVVRNDGSIRYATNSGEPFFDEQGKFLGYRGIGKDVTVAKLAEAAQKSEVRLRQLVEHLPAGAVYIEDGSTLLNKAAETLTGYSRSEIASVDQWFNVIFNSHAKLFRVQYMEDREQGFPIPREIMIRRKDGEMRIIEFAGYQDQNSEVWLFHDITQRKAAQDALEQSILEQRAILDNAFVGIYFLQNRIIQRCNRGLEEMLGYGPGELVGKPTSVVFDSDTAYQEFGRQAYDVVNAGGSWVGEWEIVDKQGRKIWGLFHGKVIDPDEPAKGSVWAMQDITERKQAEEALQQALLEQQAMFDNAIAGIEMVKDRVVQRCNRGMETMLGYGPGELIGKPTRVYYASEESWTEHGKAAYSLLTAGQPASGEWELVRKDGERIWCLYHGKPVDPNDFSKGSIWVTQDITERKRAEAALQQALLEQQALLDNSVLGIAFVVNRIIMRCNAGIEQILGYGPGELTGLSTRCWYITEEDYNEIGESLYSVTKVGRIFSRDMQFIRKNGSTVWCSLTAKSIDSRYNEKGGVCVMQDISARKETEAALIRAKNELENGLAKVEQTYRDVIVQAELSSFLQACQSPKEAYDCIGGYVPRLFPDSCGTLYLMGEDSDELIGEVSWGGETGSSPSFLPADCWALRRGQPYRMEDAHTHLYCPHLHNKQHYLSACLPLLAQGETFGLLFIQYHVPADDREQEELRHRRTVALAEQIGLALANLRLRETLRLQSIRDPLTGLFNRRYLNEILRREIIHARRTHSGLAVAIIDVDHFKQFNDTFGHDAGDLVLQSVAKALEERVRQNDFVCRFGGEEFVVALPDISFELAQERASNLLGAIRSLNLKHGGRSLGRLTASLGLAFHPLHGDTFEILIAKADSALYQAKEEGRDRVVVSSQIFTERPDSEKLV